MVANSDYEDSQADFEYRELKRLLWDILSAVLDGELNDVIISRFWLNETLTAIGKRQGRTLERVRQMERQALKKLRWNRDIKQIGKDYGYVGNSTRHVGVNRFKSTWTSSVEAEVLDREQWIERELARIMGTAQN